MSIYRLQVRDGKKTMLPVKNPEEYKRLRSSAKQLENLKQARLGKTGSKLRLEQFNYSCLPNEDGSLKGATRVGNSVGMDIDHIAPDVMQKTIDGILEKKDELGLMMLERSARGEGLHVIFRRHTDMNNEQNLRWASDLLGVEYDQGAKDITRVFFGTSSNADDLLFLSDELFDNKEVQVTCTNNSNSQVGSVNNIQGSSTNNSHDSSTNNSQPISTNKHQAGTDNNSQVSSINNVNVPSAAEPALGSDDADTQDDAEVLTYEGIPYKDILRRWWDMHYEGQEPVVGNRQVRTFELVSAMRNICGFDRGLMDKVIPCYAGFNEAEKLKCIDQALGEKMTQMPNKLKVVLQSLKPNQAFPKGRMLNTLDNKYKPSDVNSIKAPSFGGGMGEASAFDTRYSYENLPSLPQGLKDSVDGAGHSLALPTLIAIAPAIGALATGVKLDVHGRVKGLNLCVFVVGDYASGKGQLDDIEASWMTEPQAEADIYTQQEEEWAQRTRSMKSGKAPEQPKFPVRMLTLNNTVANIADRLANTDGRHCFSFTPEADNVALKWKQSVSDFSVMLRQAYDEARYDREAKSADAVRVHIPKLLWNVTMCGTQDALYRVVRNYTDGLLSRISIARTPDNTFAPLEKNPAQLTDIQSERIQQVAHVLSLMKGVLVLEKLEAHGRVWLEDIRKEALNNGDSVMARLRMRNCVNAQRITVALTLPRVAEVLINKYGLNGTETRLKQNPEMWLGMIVNQQNDDMMKLFDIIADYLLENCLYFFHDRIMNANQLQANQSSAIKIRLHRGKNDDIYSQLPDVFTSDQLLQQAILIKGENITKNTIWQMLKNWKYQGIITDSPNGTFTKVHGLNAMAVETGNKA